MGVLGFEVSLCLRWDHVSGLAVICERLRNGELCCTVEWVF